MELRDLADWTREAAGFAVVSITGRSGVGKSRLARELCAQFIPLGWHVGFAEEVNPTGVHGALELEKPALIVVDIDSDSRNANLAINIIESLSAKVLTHPVRLIVITRALAGEAWDRIRRAAEPRGLCTGRQIALDRAVLGRADQSAQYRAAFEAFSARMGSDQPRKIGSSAWLDVKDGELRHALVEPIEGRINFDRLGRATIVGRNAVNPRSILGNRVYGTPRSILLAHIAALLDVLDGGSGRTETVGPRLLDELIRREAVYWENMFGPLGIADDLQLDIVAAASFATADTKSDARRLLRSLEELSGATEERLGAIAFALHKLYPGDGKYIVSVQPDLVTERLVVPRLLENDQLRRILDNLRSASQCAHIIDVLNRAMLNPAVGHAAEILRAREIVLGRCGDAFKEA